MSEETARYFVDGREVLPGSAILAHFQGGVHRCCVVHVACVVWRGEDRIAVTAHRAPSETFDPYGAVWSLLYADDGGDNTWSWPPSPEVSGYLSAEEFATVVAECEQCPYPVNGTDRDSPVWRWLHALADEVRATRGAA